MSDELEQARETVLRELSYVGDEKFDPALAASALADLIHLIAREEISSASAGGGERPWNGTIEDAFQRGNAPAQAPEGGGITPEAIDLEAARKGGTSGAFLKECAKALRASEARLAAVEWERDEARKTHDWLIECNGRSSVRAERADDLAETAERLRDQAQNDAAKFLERAEKAEAEAARLSTAVAWALVKAEAALKAKHWSDCLTAVHFIVDDLTAALTSPETPKGGDFHRPGQHDEPREASTASGANIAQPARGADTSVPAPTTGWDKPSTPPRPSIGCLECGCNIYLPPAPDLTKAREALANLVADNIEYAEKNNLIAARRRKVLVDAEAALASLREPSK